MNQFADTYYVEELDHDFTVKIDFDVQPAEPDVGIMDSYIENISVEFLYAEGWVAVDVVNLDESTINEKCWAFINMNAERDEDAKAEAAEAQREMNMSDSLCEEENLYENR